MMPKASWDAVGAVPGSEGGTASLLHGARLGSPAALGRLLDECRQYLLIVAERELEGDLRAKAGASDLVQESLLEAQQAFDRFQGTTQEALLAWTRKILLRNVADFRRRYRQTERRHVRREVSLAHTASLQDVSARLAAADTSPSGQAIRKENVESVRQAIGRLPAEYRQVIDLRHGQQLTFSDVGRAMGRSADAARMLWWRAFERLAEELEGANRAP